MKFKIGSILIFFILLILTVDPGTVFAHVLKTDGTIGAVLHIDPEDDPIANSQSAFFFEFKDTQNKFDPVNCDCTFSISEHGKKIYSQALFQSNPDPSLTNASVFYTFPQKDVYVVEVSGKPSDSNSFQQFDLKYDVRVAREANSPAGTNSATAEQPSWIQTHTIHLIGGGVVLAFFIFALIKQNLNGKKVTK